MRGVTCEREAALAICKVYRGGAWSSLFIIPEL